MFRCVLFNSHARMREQGKNRDQGKKNVTRLASWASWCRCSQSRLAWRLGRKHRVTQLISCWLHGILWGRGVSKKCYTGRHEYSEQNVCNSCRWICVYLKNRNGFRFSTRNEVFLLMILIKKMLTLTTIREWDCKDEVKIVKEWKHQICLRLMWKIF